MVTGGIIKTKQSGQISKLDETMQKSAEMLQQLIHMTGANEQMTKALTEQVSVMGAKTNMIIEARAQSTRNRMGGRTTGKMQAMFRLV
jgi:hypothetical protein